MTPHELKNWLRGFSEAISEETPTPAQWAIIKAKLAEDEPVATLPRQTWGGQTFSQNQQNQANYQTQTTGTPGHLS